MKFGDKPIIVEDVQKPKKYKRVTCCHYCKRTDGTLFVLRNDEGKKTKDYVCAEHRFVGSPSKPNTSFVQVAI